MRDELSLYQAQLTYKKRLEAVLAELRSQQEPLLKKATELEKIMIRERKDVDRLEAHGVTAFFYLIAGKMDEKLDTERREYYATRAKYDSCIQELDAINQDIEATEEDLADLADCEERYAKALEAKRHAVEAAGTPEGKTLLKQNHVGEGDLLIIHSVSGRNTVPVEMAEEAGKLGARTVCITNLNYSRAVTSRHPSGKRLFEVSDLVIDNCGAFGDAAVQLDGLPEKIGATSTVVGAALINAIVIEAVEKMIADGIVPPVFMSANIDGGDEHNAKIFEEYRDNIFYM